MFVAVGVAVGVQVGVWVAVAVGVAVGVPVEVGGGGTVGVQVGVGVGVRVDVGVTVGVGVFVRVRVGVGSGGQHTYALVTHAAPPASVPFSAGAHTSCAVPPLPSSSRQQIAFLTSGPVHVPLPPLYSCWTSAPERATA